MYIADNTYRNTQEVIPGSKLMPIFILKMWELCVMYVLSRFYHPPRQGIVNNHDKIHFYLFLLLDGDCLTTHINYSYRIEIHVKNSFHFDINTRITKLT